MDDYAGDFSGLDGSSAGFSSGEATSRGLDNQVSHNDASFLGGLVSMAKAGWSSVKSFASNVRERTAQVVGNMAGNALRVAAAPGTAVLDTLDPGANWDQKVENFGSKWGTIFARAAFRTPAEALNGIQSTLSYDNDYFGPWSSTPTTFSEVAKVANEQLFGGSNNPLTRLAGKQQSSIAGAKPKREEKGTTSHALPFYGQNTTRVVRKRRVVYK